MRVLWLSHFVPYPPSGGALQRSHNLLRQAARAHEVHLVALNQGALLGSPEAVAEAVRLLSDVCASVRVFPNAFDGSRVGWAWMAARGFWRSTPYDLNWLEQPALAAYLTPLTERLSFDLVHVDTLGLMPYASVRPRVPAILNHHNVESAMMRRRADHERGLRRLYCRHDAEKLERYERRACRQAAVNITVSTLDAERLRALVGELETAVVENGVDVEYFRPVPDSRPRAGNLVFVGTMNWYPNQDAMRYFLRDVWPRLLADNPERSLTVVGRDPPTEVVAAARDPRVRAPGFVPDVRTYLAAAAVYVCPIRDGGGTRLKVLDALAMAKPLVATGLAVEGLHLDEERHYLRAETPDEFVRQVGRLERDSELGRRLGEAGRRLVETRYSWDVIGEKLLQAYDAARVEPRGRVSREAS